MTARWDDHTRVVYAELSFFCFAFPAEGGIVLYENESKRQIAVLAAVNTGSGKRHGALWYNVGRFVYVPLAALLCGVALIAHVAF
jgi:hypothetical protein